MSPPSASKHRENIASNIRAAAGRMGLRQADIAKVTGLSRSAVNRKWRGAAPITIDEYLAIADALDMNPADLLPQQDDAEPAADDAA